ncbi:hypothetical protein DHEL01_v200756 [Diaporthe helianthi]|uniref:Uncharacterized protein n=1 Tax=Diaporthe helianthi TaxID=158607 RepID=A0A2P5IEB0_DIAHE|nr:hypothetical protein DHEL01_v200756 [Diaporthe helianthi]
MALPSSIPAAPAREAGQSSATPRAPATPVVATPVVAPTETVPGTAVAHAVSNASKKRAEREALLDQTLAAFDSGVQAAVRSWLKVPYDSLRLRNFEMQVDDEPGLRATERDTLKALVRLFGKKERKRPRDRILRDPRTERVAMELRKKMAFLGYDWKRMQVQTQAQTASVCPPPEFEHIAPMAAFRPGRTSMG